MRRKNSKTAYNARADGDAAQRVRELQALTTVEMLSRFIAAGMMRELASYGQQ